MLRRRTDNRAGCTGMTFLVLLLSVSPSPAVRADTDGNGGQAAIDAWREDHEREIIKDFISLLAIPNVASDLRHMEQNAAHIVGLLEQRGFETRVLVEGGAPYVYAELPAAGASETVLIYAHFDGQP
ncbi:MAG TPA: hypothetical protein VLB07_01415, partial [Woeseiaceae bacterium]|nr:hypothetical protein [Woeseiaceae bacterium]